MLFNALITYDKNGAYRLEMAESYRFITPTRLQWRLKQGLVWHDGHPVSADDIRFTWQLACSPKLFSPYGELFHHIRDVKVIDRQTVEVIYKKPYFKALEIWMAPILPRHRLQRDQDVMTSSFNRAPIGSGPWRLERFEPTKIVTLQAHAHHRPHPPRIPSVAMHIVPDASARMLMLRKGELDISDLSPLQLERQIDDAFKKRYAIYEQPGNSYTYLGFNLTLPKFADARVRRALSLAIDRQELVDLLLFGHGTICHGPFLPGSIAYNPEVKAPRRNLAEAKRLLALAGYGPKRPLRFEITTSSSNTTRLYAAQILQKQLAAVGVEVTIRAMEWQAFLQTVVMPRRFETVLLGWSMPIFPDAYSVWHSASRKKGGFNFIGYRNQEVDRLIEEAEGEIKQERIGQIYRELFARIVADDPYLFLYIPNSITAINRAITPIEPGLTGITHNIIDWIKP